MGSKGITKVHQGNIFGRIGTGIGQGLAEQVPKEIERQRMLSDVNRFEQDYKNLTPMQQVVRAHSIYGSTPQLTQSVTELARRENQGNALINRPDRNEPIPNARPNEPARIPNSQVSKEAKNLTPSLTTIETEQARLNPAIPKTPEQKKQRAGELIAQDPYYQGRPELALQDAEAEDANRILQNEILARQGEVQEQTQSDIEKELQRRIQSANAKVPDTVYQKVRDKAIDAVKNQEMTKKQAADFFGKEMDDISREYNAIQTTGEGSFFNNSAEEMKRELRTHRENFKKRDDLENLAYEYQSKNGLSPSKAFYLAYPVSDYKETNNAIHKLKKLDPFKSAYIDPVAETNRIAPELAKLMKKEGASVLSIGEELKSRGYSDDAWIKYVDKHKQELDISGRQDRELKQKRNIFPTMNDMWFFYGAGLDKLAEQ